MPEKKTKQKEDDTRQSKEYQDKIDELTDTLKRVQAEFINYKQRVEKENRNMIDYSNADLVRKLLPVLDSFELALKSSKNPDEFLGPKETQKVFLGNSQDPAKFKQGMEMLYAQLFDALKQEGLSVVDASGKFDPYLHEVLLKEKSDQPEDTILEVLQKGYKIKDKIIRHAKVKISG